MTEHGSSDCLVASASLGLIGCQCFTSWLRCTACLYFKGLSTISIVFPFFYALSFASRLLFGDPVVRYFAYTIYALLSLLSMI